MSRFSVNSSNKKLQIAELANFADFVELSNLDKVRKDVEAYKLKSSSLKQPNVVIKNVENEKTKEEDTTHKSSMQDQLKSIRAMRDEKQSNEQKKEWPTTLTTVKTNSFIPKISSKNEKEIMKIGSPSQIRKAVRSNVKMDLPEPAPNTFVTKRAETKAEPQAAKNSIKSTDVCSNIKIDLSEPSPSTLTTEKAKTKAYSKEAGGSSNKSKEMSSIDNVDPPEISPGNLATVKTVIKDHSYESKSLDKSKPKEMSTKDNPRPPDNMDLPEPSPNSLVPKKAETQAESSNNDAKEPADNYKIRKVPTTTFEFKIPKKQSTTALDRTIMKEKDKKETKINTVENVVKFSEAIPLSIEANKLETVPLKKKSLSNIPIPPPPKSKPPPPPPSFKPPPPPPI